MMRRLIKGHLGLAATFWGFGVAGWILCVLVFLRSTQFIAQVGSSYGLTSAVAFLAVFLGGYWLFTVIAVLSIWRSAARYTGKRVWPLLAKIFSFTPGLFILVLVVFQGMPLSHNPNTREVVSNLRPTEDMPYVGFWKTSRFVSHGIAIAPAQEGFYSVSFCGPGGCFEPGKWTPNTKLVDDPHYRIIDMDTIQILGKSEVTTYHRS